MAQNLMTPLNSYKRYYACLRFTINQIAYEISVISKLILCLPRKSTYSCISYPWDTVSFSESRAIIVDCGNHSKVLLRGFHHNLYALQLFLMKYKRY